MCRRPTSASMSAPLAIAAFWPGNGSISRNCRRLPLARVCCVSRFWPRHKPPIRSRPWRPGKHGAGARCCGGGGRHGGPRLGEGAAACLLAALFRKSRSGTDCSLRAWWQERGISFPALRPHRMSPLLFADSPLFAWNRNTVSAP
jgi:hypothetical protein